MTGTLTTKPDLTLIISAEGVIQEAIVGASLSDESLDEWVGQHWESTVADVGPAKVRRLLDTARDERAGGFSQINQCLPSGRELLMEFSAVRPDAERRGIVAVGRSLSIVREQQRKLLVTQQSIEREYWKLRDIETRYRALIKSTSEAVVLVREHDLQVVEANPLARDLLNLSNDNEVHSALEFGADTIRIRNMLDETNRSGEAPSTLVHLGPKRAAWRVKATIVRGMHEQHFLLQFSKIDSRVTSARFAAVEGPSQEGFVIIDADGFVRMANEPFAELTGNLAASTLVGQHIRTWFKDLQIEGIAASTEVHMLEAPLTVQAERKQPVKISVCDLKVLEEGGTALMIEALAPIPELH